MRRKNAGTEFLKECMADALLKLLEEKPMENITVSEITKKANVARVTFYRHFTSKEDLLYFKCRLIGERWYTGLTAEQIADTAFLTESFFELMYSMKDTLLTLLNAKLYLIVLLALYHSMREDTDISDKAGVYSAAFISFGMCGILTEWLNNGCRETPKELARLTLQNIAPQT